MVGRLYARTKFLNFVGVLPLWTSAVMICDFDPIFEVGSIFDLHL